MFVSAFNALMVQAVPLAFGQAFPHPPKLLPVAFKIIGPVPTGKTRLHVAVQVTPNGWIDTDPVPAPMNVIVRVADVPEKQVTFAVIVPVTREPEEPIPPVLLFVVTVAETNELPHETPVATNTPLGLTVTIWVSFEVHLT